MHADLENIGWTEEQWNRIATAVTEEAQKNRVAAQALQIVGPEDPTTVAVPNFTFGPEPNPHEPHPPDRPHERPGVDSYPTLWLTTIAINVPLHAHEASDPDLKAAMVMFRRAANYIARLEDALIFNGRPNQNMPPAAGIGGIPDIYRVTGPAPVQGIFFPDPGRQNQRIYQQVGANPARQEAIVNAIVNAINQLDAHGQLGPYACFLGHELFNRACDPTANLVLPRDRILPFLDGGPLLRCSAILPNYGVVIALSGNPVEIVVASEISVRFLQTTLEPRFVFRVSERIAPRIKEDSAIAVLVQGDAP
jgi:uncharacterized linocin/CFP29 family protein